MTEPALLKPREAAAFLSIGLRTLYSLRSAGKFPKPVCPPGVRAPRYRRADLERYAASLKTPRG